MKKHSVHEMCRVAIIAAVYVALTMVNPISWGTMQFSCCESGVRAAVFG